MRARYDLLVLSSLLLLSACGGGGSSGSSNSGGTPGTPTIRPTKTATLTETPGGPTHTPKPTRTPTSTELPGANTHTPKPTQTPQPPLVLYVRANGNDDNDGMTKETAFKTVVRAAQVLRPSTTVYVGPGHYRGRVAITGVSGTASQPVELIADRKGEHTGDAPGDVIIDADGDIIAVNITKSPYVTVDGFLVTGAVPQTTPKAAGLGIQVRSASNNATVQNCVIGNAGPSDGLRVDGSSDVLVFNNLIFENDRGVIVSGDSPRVRIINNTIANQQRAGLLLTQKGGVAPVDATVTNNIIQGNENNIAIQIDQGPPSSQAGYKGNYNLVFEPGAGDQSKVYSPSNARGMSDINADALFLNVGQGDVHLAPGSPAINKGTNGIGADLVAELFKRSTTEDGAVDKTPLDMGYHYPR
jgi:hypothetical protein